MSFSGLGKQIHEIPVVTSSNGKMLPGYLNRLVYKAETETDCNTNSDSALSDSDNFKRKKNGSLGGKSISSEGNRFKKQQNSKSKKNIQRMRFRCWFQSLQQIRFWQIRQRKSFKTRRWNHLRADQGALFEIDEGLKAEKIRIDSFAILFNFQKRRQKASRRDGWRIQIERPVQWWVIAPLNEFELRWEANLEGFRG